MQGGKGLRPPDGSRQPRLKNIFLTQTIILLAGVFNTAAEADLTLKASHDNIKIDFFYNGEKIGIEGAAEPDVDLIVKIASQDGEQTLRKKGKLAGILWMNIGDITFRRAPNLYFVCSTRKTDEILSKNEADKYMIGYKSLENHIEITPAVDKDEKAALLAEFIKFKESSGLYSSSYGKISTSEREGKEGYYMSFDWPYQAPPAKYLITAYSVKNNRVIEKAEAVIIVEQAGIVRTLADMAKNNGAIYGILSIAIALAAGFAVGFIFRKGGSH